MTRQAANIVSRAKDLNLPFERVYSRKKDGKEIIKFWNTYAEGVMITERGCKRILSTLGIEGEVTRKHHFNSNHYVYSVIVVIPVQE